MKILKDDHAAVLHRVYQFRGRDRLSVAVLVGFKLNPVGALIPEDEMWALAADHLSRGQVLDLGMPKPHAEVLMAARAHAESSRPVPSLHAGFRVGNIQKSLIVHGDRYWLDGADRDEHVTRPLPFTVMDLTWQRSFGGPGFGRNPIGKGMPLAEKEATPLPNIEDPNDPIVSPDDRPRPVGFGPLGLDWPDRLTHLGTFDQAWLVEQWPGLPDDFDFGYFNLAPNDQILDGFFKGDETMAAVNLHPGEKNLESTLPGIKARLFLRLDHDVDEKKSGPDEPNWIEPETELDTVWLFPHVEAGVLIWHGTLAVRDDEAGDVVELVVSLETLDGKPLAPPEEIAPASMEMEKSAAAPESAETEAPVLASAVVAPVILTGAVPSPYDDWPEELARFKPLNPNPPPGASPEQMAAHFEEQAALEQRRFKDHLRELGLDPDAVPQPPQDYPEELAPFKPLNPTPKPDSTPEEMAAHFEDQAGLEQERLKNYFREHGVDPDAPMPEPQAPPVKTVEELVSEIKQMPGDHQSLIDSLYEMEAHRIQAEAEYQASWAEAKEAAALAEAAAAKAAEAQALAAGVGIPSPDLLLEPVTPENLQALLVEGKSLAGQDLTGWDLTGFNLAGKDLSGSILEKADLSNLDLSGIGLRGALLAGAGLAGSKLSGAGLSGASAAGSDFKGADLSGADLTGADLSGADLTGADLTKAVLTGADLSGARMVGVKGNQVQAERLRLSGADLSQADFFQANLKSANISEARLTETNFSQADVSEAWFSDSSAQKANFSQAVMSKAKAEGQTDFAAANFSQADLSQTYFETADFSQADFSSANLSGASMNRCQLNLADLSQARALGADLAKSDLTGANLKAINLMDGSLRKTRLVDADLRQANLFGVDVYRCRHGRTRISGANLKQTLVSMWQEDE